MGDTDVPDARVTSQEVTCSSAYVSDNVYVSDIDVPVSDIDIMGDMSIEPTYNLNVNVSSVRTHKIQKKKLSHTDRAQRYKSRQRLNTEDSKSSCESASYGSELGSEPSFNTEESVLLQTQSREELRQRLQVAERLARRGLPRVHRVPDLAEDSGYSAAEEEFASNSESPEVDVPCLPSVPCNVTLSRPEKRRRLRVASKIIKEAELSEAETDTTSNGFLKDSTHQPTTSLLALSANNIERPQRCPRVHGYLCNESNKIRCRLLLDTGASHNFLSGDIAAALHLTANPDLGPPALSGAHPDHPVVCSGMLRNVGLQLPVVGQPTVNMPVNFVVSEISHADVILGMPWWNAVKASLEYSSNSVDVTTATAIRININNENGPYHQVAIPLLTTKTEAKLLSAAPKSVKGTKQMQKLLGRGCEFFRITVHDPMWQDSEELHTDTSAVQPIPLSQLDITKAMADVESDTTAYPNATTLTTELIAEFADVFAPPYKLPPPRAYDHIIETEGRVPPPSRRVPRFSLAELEIIRVWLKDMVDKGWMAPSRSPYGAPLLVVRKPGGGHRVVQDMRALNSITKKAATPLPIFENLILSFSGAKYFSTLDMASFFFQIRLREEDRELTSVTTPYGLYEFRVAAMGLVNSPSTALLIMQDILRDYIGKDIGVFMDDIIVHSTEELHHCRVLREILTIFRKQELHVSLGKCHFLRSRVTFLGHIVGKDGLQANPESCAAIATWPRPLTLTQLRAFLGLTSFYRRFIKDFATIAAPLTSLLASDSGFPASPKAWGTAQEAAFVELRRLLSSPPILRLYDPELPFVLRTDASEFAMGCALYQIYPDGLLYPIEFRSRKFTSAQTRYCAHEREFLAVLMALRELRCYLRGVPFTLQTDNSAVAHIKTSRELTSKYARWFDEFEEYPCEVQHRPGTSMRDCDALSRRDGQPDVNDLSNPPMFDPDNRGSSFFSAEGTLNFSVIGNCCLSPEYARLKEKPSLESYGQNRWPSIEYSSEIDDTQLYVAKGKRGKTDAKTPAKSIAAWHHPTVSDWGKAYATDSDFKHLWNNGKGQPGSQFRVVNKLLYKVDDRPGRVRKAWETPAQQWWRLCIPNIGTARVDYLHELHSAPLAGHRGRNATLERAKSNLFWPNMSEDVKEFVRSCTCQFHKIDRTKPSGQAKSLPVPTRPWSIISADWIGPLPPCTTGHDTILVIVCHLSGQLHLVPCRNSDDAVDTADAFLQNVIRLHGLPHAIVSDRDPKFTSIFWKSLCERLGTQLRMSTAFYPQSDGKTERYNAVIEEVLRCYVNARQDDWIDWLPHVEFAINSSTSQTTGLTPFFINYGFEPAAPWVIFNPSPQDNDPASSAYATDLQSIHEFARDALQRAKDRQEKALNKRRNLLSKPFQVGDQVLLTTKNLNLRTPGYKLSSRYLGPFKVLSATSNTVTLDTPDAAITARKHNVFNVASVRHYYSRPTRLFSEADKPPKPFLVHGVPHWEIDGVIAKRKRGKFSEYLVVWKGLPLASCSWQPPEDIDPWYRALFDNRYPSDGDGLDDLDEFTSAKKKMLPVQIPLPLAPSTGVRFSSRLKAI
jgi:hypothetical protein